MLGITPEIAGRIPSCRDVGYPYSVTEDTGAERFAKAAIQAVCGAGQTPWAARRTYQRCMDALAGGGTARMGLRHKLRAQAVDRLWRERAAFHRRVEGAADRRAALETLPGIGPALASRLAAELGFEPH